MVHADIFRYDYFLPPELIRKQGIEPRDAARLFVYDTATDSVTHDTFVNLAAYLPKHALMVINETRVVPARLMLRKETGGKIEVFVLANEISAASDMMPVLVDRKCVPGMRLLFPDGSVFEVVSQAENRFFVRLHSERTLAELLDAYGETPIPHYLEDRGIQADEVELRKRYQTVFARSGASVAAPTASLHFTDRVFASLSEKDIDTVKVGLDVGLGTFAPLTEKNFETKTLHRERIAVSNDAAERLNRAKMEGDPIVAVGTTTLRTLESVILKEISKNTSSARRGEGREGVEDAGDTTCLFQSYSGETDIFLFHPHRFRSADILVTNFHLPKSSLMLLVDAFLRDKEAKRNLVSLYGEAIREGYAFYSFGDSMLIL
ncbi:MAG TPA: tRNA preQ1(34) S-adenosylmethionine ribosyltransferase-isomerase QueA [Candidatus Fimivivens sp.]|nr:tRNA preQ1(34) S-adenosylmethionine ribosyltransferase-isomerase QueA [Candidatus Fimivivens sp.]